MRLIPRQVRQGAPRGRGGARPRIDEHTILSTDRERTCGAIQNIYNRSRYSTWGLCIMRVKRWERGDQTNGEKKCVTARRTAMAHGAEPRVPTTSS